MSFLSRLIGSFQPCFIVFSGLIMNATVNGSFLNFYVEIVQCKNVPLILCHDCMAFLCGTLVLPFDFPYR